VILSYAFKASPLLQASLKVANHTFKTFTDAYYILLHIYIFLKHSI